MPFIVYQLVTNLGLGAFFCCCLFYCQLKGYQGIHVRPYESELINAPQSGFNYSKLLGINSARVMAKRLVGLDDKKKIRKRLDLILVK